VVRQEAPVLVVLVVLTLHSVSKEGPILIFLRLLVCHLIQRVWDGQGWSGEVDLGGILNASPGACSWGFNRIDVFYPGQNVNLLHRAWDGQTWTAEEDLGGRLHSSPAACSWGFNRICNTMG